MLSKLREVMLCFALLVGVSAPLRAAQWAPDTDHLDLALEYSKLAMDVYNLDSKGVDGWNMVVAPKVLPSGLQYAVYERPIQNGRTELVVSYAGTNPRSVRDWATNFDQGVVTSVSDYMSTPAQYEDALKIARQYQASSSNVEMKAVGHSLGGGQAQYVAVMMEDVWAVPFNSAGLAPETLKNASTAQQNRAHLRILNVQMEDDPVSALPGVQIGMNFDARPAPGTARVLDMDVPNLALTGGWTTRRIDNQLARHEMATMVAGLNYQRAYGRPTTYRDLAPKPQARIKVPTRIVENLASAVDALASALNEFKLHKRLSNPIAQELFTPARKSLSKTFDKVNKLYALSSAINRDLDQFAGRDFVVLQSHTLEQAARLGLEFTLPHFQKVLKDNGVIKKAYPTFGAVELLTAASRHVGAGKADIETITGYFDAANSAAWATLGWVVSGGNVKTAEAFQKIGSTAAKLGRDWTLPMFTRGFSSRHKLDQTYNDMWRTAQESNLARGVATKPFEDFFGADVLKSGGITQKQIRRHQQSYDADLASGAFGSIPEIRASVQDITTPGVRGVRDMDLAMRLTPSTTQRVVVTGRGQASDYIYEQSVRRWGNGNVTRYRRTQEHIHVQQVARAFGADAVLSAVPRTESRGSQMARMGLDHLQSRPQVSVPTVPKPSIPSYQPPVRQASYGVGGVMLHGAAAWEDEDGFSPPESFSLVFGNGNASLDIGELRRFVTALWAVYFSEDGPGISIDPIAPGVDEHLVRYIGHVLNSDLGRVMREADYLMKKWSVGSDRADFPDYENPDDIAGRNGRVVTGSWSRFWFVPEQMRFRRVGSGLLFDSGSMTLRTEALNGSRRNPANEEWARWFTQNYTGLAERYEVLDELFTYARLVSLAHHLKEQRVPLLWFLLANRELLLTEDSPGTVEAFVEKSTHFDVIIEGGVDLAAGSAAGGYVIDEKAARALARARSRRTPPARSSLETPNPIIEKQTRGPRAQENRVVSVAKVAEEAWSVADPESLSLSSSSAFGHVFQTDFAMSQENRRGLEIVRFYDPDRTGPTSIGGGWHMLVPLEISIDGHERIDFENVTLPRKMRLRNLLSGIDEELTFSQERYTTVGWVPEAEQETLTVGLFLMTNGSMRLVDRTGAEFHFSPSGELTWMHLAPDYELDLEYTASRIDRTAFGEAPWRLEPSSEDGIETSGLRLPQTLRVTRTRDQRIELFTYDPDEENIAYTSYSGREQRQVFLLEDGSFRLESINAEITFDAAGDFVAMERRVLSEIRQGDHRATLTYEWAGEEPRATQLEVKASESDELLMLTQYEYDADGMLIGTSNGSRLRRIEYNGGYVAAVVADAR